MRERLGLKRRRLGVVSDAKERLGIRERRLGVVIDGGNCIDCRACMVACKAENDVPEGRSRNRVHRRLRGSFPQLAAAFEPEQCHHCESPSCVRVCPTGASYRRSDGLVMVEADDCIGCGYCIIACPYDARFFNEETRVVDKCTMCAHRVDAGGQPACVETCPTKVRVFGDLADTTSAASRLLARSRSEVRKPQSGNEPQLHYLL